MSLLLQALNGPASLHSVHCLWLTGRRHTQTLAQANSQAERNVQSGMTSSIWRSFSSQNLGHVCGGNAGHGNLLQRIREVCTLG